LEGKIDDLGGQRIGTGIGCLSWKDMRGKKMRLLAKESYGFIGEPNIFECHDSNWTIAHVNSNYVKALSTKTSPIFQVQKKGVSPNSSSTREVCSK
jgi:hypothetical protein